MTLQRREKILASAAGGMALVAVLWFLLMGGTSRDDMRKKRDGLQKSVETKQRLLVTTKADAKKLGEWQQRALPSDPAPARSKYLDWIRGLADKAGFRQLNVAPSDGATKKNIYAISTFTVSGRADLTRLTKFLYEFYSAGHLQKITRMDVKLGDKPGELDAKIVVEAMSLYSTDRTDQLSKEPGKALQGAKSAEYTDVIVKRNIFAPFVPTQSRPEFDLARYTFVTAITEVDGRNEVWLHDRTADKVWKLPEGKTFRVGSVQGSVKGFIWPQVILSVDGRSRLFRQGDNLRGGVEVPAGQPSQARANVGPAVAVPSLE